MARSLKRLYTTLDSSDVWRVVAFPVVFHAWVLLVDACPQGCSHRMPRWHILRNAVFDSLRQHELHRRLLLCAGFVTTVTHICAVQLDVLVLPRWLWGAYQRLGRVFRRQYQCIAQ